MRLVNGVERYKAAKIRVERRGGKIVDKEYVSASKKVEVVCEEGHTFTRCTIPTLIYGTNWCNICKPKRYPGDIKYEFLEFLAEHGWTLLTPFTSPREEVTVRCNEGHKISYTPNACCRGDWCRICTLSDKEQARLNFERVVEEQGGILKSPYVKGKNKVKIQCKNIHIFKSRPNDVTSVGRWCPKCSGKCPIQAEEKFRDYVKGRGGTVTGQYVNTITDVEVTCSEGHKWEQGPNTMTSCLSWCPTCYQSRGEAMIMKALNQEGFDYDTEYVYEDLPKRRFDFRVLINNEVYVIEFDGKQHFKYNQYFLGNEEKFVQIQQRDREKSTFCLEREINLIRIPYTYTREAGEVAVAMIKDKAQGVTFYDTELYHEHLTTLGWIA